MCIRDSYYIYVMDDRKLYSHQSLFLFSDSAVEIKPNSSPVTVYAFVEEKPQPLSSTISFAGGNRPGAKPDERRLRFTSSGNMQDLLGDFYLNFECPLRNLDTTKLQVSTDSTFNPVSSRWEIDSLKKRLTLK